MEEKPLIKRAELKQMIHDESLFSGRVDSLSAPATPEEICEIIRYCSLNNIHITPRGGLTGVNGAGVPAFGHSMDMRKNNFLSYRENDCTIWAQAGASFAEIETFVRKSSGDTREFPVSPTEKSATLGGGIALNASGLRSYKYGRVSDFVIEIEYCNNDGVLHLVDKSDKVFYEIINSEGMLAIITGARLLTAPVPDCTLGLLFFFPDDICAAEFADNAVGVEYISVFELCDTESLHIVKEYRQQIGSVSRLPEIPDSGCAIIYIELEGNNENELERAAEHLMGIADEYGGDTDNIWTAEGNETEAFRLLRHAVSECINLKVAELHSRESIIGKLSFAALFPNRTRAELLHYYKESLIEHKLYGAVFGHIGSCSPYVNIIAYTTDEYFRALTLIEEWSSDVFRSGGQAFNECGVGKLFRRIYSDTATADCFSYKEELKHNWDPKRIFNPNNMLM